MSLQQRRLLLSRYMVLTNCILSLHTSLCYDQIWVLQSQKCPLRWRVIISEPLRSGREDQTIYFPEKKTWAGACNERSSTIEYHPTPSLHFISQPYNQGESRPMVYINIHDSSYEWISILGYRIESVWRQAAKWSTSTPWDNYYTRSQPALVAWRGQLLAVYNSSDVTPAVSRIA